MGTDNRYVWFAFRFALFSFRFGFVSFRFRFVLDSFRFGFVSQSTVSPKLKPAETVHMDRAKFS